MKEIRKKTESVITLFLLMVLAVVTRIWILPAQIPETNAALNTSGTFTPRTFPGLLLVVIAVLCFVGVVSNLVSLIKLRRQYADELSAKKPEKEKKSFGQIVENLIPYIIFAILILYWFLITKIGFLISTLIITTMILALLRCKKWYLYLATWIYSGTLYLIFTKVLYVRLP